MSKRLNRVLEDIQIVEEIDNMIDTRYPYWTFFLGKCMEWLGGEKRFSVHYDKDQIFCKDFKDFYCELQEGAFYCFAFEDTSFGITKGKCGFIIEMSGEEIENIDDKLAEQLASFTKTYTAEGVKNAVRQMDRYQDSIDGFLLEGELWEAFCIQWPEITGFSVNDLENEQRKEIVTLLVYGMHDYDGEGFTYPSLLRITNPAIDQWMLFLKSGQPVDEKYLTETKWLFHELAGKSPIDSCEDTVLMLDKSEEWASFVSMKKEDTQVLRYQVLHYIMDDGEMQGYYVDKIKMGILSIGYLRTAVKVKAFLEKMEKKYHFLEWEGDYNAKEKNTADKAA